MSVKSVHQSGRSRSRHGWQSEWSSWFQRRGDACSEKNDI